MRSASTWASTVNRQSSYSLPSIISCKSIQSMSEQGGLTPCPLFVGNSRHRLLDQRRLTRKEARTRAGQDNVRSPRQTLRRELTSVFRTAARKRLQKVHVGTVYLPTGKVISGP